MGLNYDWAVNYIPVDNGSRCVVNTAGNSDGFSSGSGSGSNSDRSGKNGFLTHLNNWSGRLDWSGNWCGSGNRSGIGGRKVIGGIHFNNTNGLGLDKGLSHGVNDGLRSGSET